MSSQPRQVTEHVDVCDLCGKPVDTYGHRDWSALNFGHGGAKPTTPEKTVFKFFRWARGRRESGAPEGDYRDWKWDFHGECLVKALMPLVADEARRVTES
mgnify:CR=1 FL=1